MMTRKHYLDNHRVGMPTQIAATAFSMAAVTEGERVELVDGHAVMVMGDPAPGQVEAFAAAAAGHVESMGRSGRAAGAAAA